MMGEMGMSVLVNAARVRVAVAALTLANTVGYSGDRALAAMTVTAQAQDEQPADPSRPGRTSEQRRREAEGHLQNLYTFYFAVKGCAEASEELGKPEYKPSISLDDARRTMTAADSAAKSAGLDTASIWAKAAPLGELTAAGLESDTPGNLGNCRRSTRLFRIIVSRFQTAVAALGFSGTLIEKDF